MNTRLLTDPWGRAKDTLKKTQNETDRQTEKRKRGREREREREREGEELLDVVSPTGALRRSRGGRRRDTRSDRTARQSRQTYSLMCFLQGTEFLMQVPVSLSTSSTMTKGFSSRVTMLRWLSSISASPNELKRGHTGYLTVRVRFSQRPI